MQQPHYITASSKIENKAVYQNTQLVFENEASDVSAFLLAIYQHLELKYPKFYKMDNLSKLGWLASEVLFKPHFQERKNLYQPEDVGLLFINANSSLDTDLNYYESTQTIASPALFVYTLPNIVMGEICIKNGFKGENAFFVADSFDSDFIHKIVDNLLINNHLQACICGWVELIRNEYKAFLMLVEKEKIGEAIVFNEQNIEKLWKNLSAN